MKVIARDSRAVQNGELIKDKIYHVIYWSETDSSGYWVYRTDYFINPREANFYIRVISEDGKPYTYWNDYFLSTEEAREFILEKIGL
jgi:hypothetical protein